jgi:hypothetical protein
VTDETLPPGAYEAADEAFEAFRVGTEAFPRDELEAALAAAEPLIRAAERERIAKLADKAGAVYDEDGDGVPEPFADLIREPA